MVPQALHLQFRDVLNKGWVDSKALHLFENLLNMGGVFWFTNNLVKVCVCVCVCVLTSVSDPSVCVC